MSKAAFRAHPFRQIVRTISAVFDDWAYAQRRIAELNTAPDRYLAHPDAPPDTYAEFLHRTSGILHREPPARARTRCS